VDSQCEVKKLTALADYAAGELGEGEEGAGYLATMLDAIAKVAPSGSTAQSLAEYALVAAIRLQARLEMATERCMERAMCREVVHV
jgi:hypothetical protein